MAVISALCEIHPHLRIANLYVKLSKSTTGSILSAASVKDNSICLESEDGDKYQTVMLKFPVSVKLLDNYKFQATVIDEEYVHLRMPIGVPPGMTSGSASTEVLDLMTLTTTFSSPPEKMFIPTVEKEYRIQCAECQSLLVDDVRFKRVLPLPRAEWSEAASDWYCHLHAGEANHQKLVPRSTDCLYSSCYHALAASLLIEGSLAPAAATGRRESLCAKCQSSLGLIGDGLLNVWCHSVHWLEETDNTWRPITTTTNPLQAFYFTLYDALEEEKSFFGRKLAFRGSSGSSPTLILWFVGDNGFTLESIHGDEPMAQIELRSSRLHKVLFKTTSSNEKIPSDVGEYQISGEMMNSVLTVLRNSLKLLPPACRTAAGFSIGYLSLASRTN